MSELPKMTALELGRRLASILSEKHPTVTNIMCKEAVVAYAEGKLPEEMPHGEIGQAAFKIIHDAEVVYHTTIDAMLKP